MAAPAVRRRDPRRAPSGAAAPSTTRAALIAICEAVERLLEAGPRPAQDVWLSFGCDEEVSGHQRRSAVDELVRRGVRPWFVLDEGGAVAHEAFPGVAAPARRDRRRREGHHLAAAARRGPRRARVDPGPARPDRPDRPGRRCASSGRRCRRTCPTRPSSCCAGWRRTPPPALRPLLANAGRLRPLLTRALLAAGPESAALTRTTFAVTTLSGSPALNVIASTRDRRRQPADHSSATPWPASSSTSARRSPTTRCRSTSSTRDEPSPVSPVDDDAFRAARVHDRRAVPGRRARAVRDDGRDRLAPLHRDLRARLPVRAVPDDQGAARVASTPTTSTSASTTSSTASRWYRRLIEGLPA